MSDKEKSIKIVYVGAGSAAWALTIVRDLIISQTLSKSEIVFVDINREKLEYTTRLAKMYNEITGGGLKINKSEKLEEALKDADFVINSVLAGNGHVLQEKVREISEKYDYYRGIESREFNMVSDYSTLYSAYDQYSYILDLIEKMHDIIPDAWLVSVSNPMFELETMMVRENKIKAISYCDGTLHYKAIAKFFGLDPNNIEYQMAGINHNIWLTKLSYEGQDQYYRIEDWVKNRAEQYWKNDPFYTTYDNNIDIHKISEHVQFSMAAVDMYSNYGLFPVGDTVRSGTWKYHYDLQTKKKWYGPYGGFDSEIGWGRYLSHIDANNKMMMDFPNLGKDKILEEIPPKLGEDPVIPFIQAILFDTKIRAHFDIKNDNKGEKIIPYLPNNVAVEVPVIIDGKGIHPEKVNGLNSRIIKEVLLPRTINMEIALDAFYSGRKDVLLDSLYRDPRTHSNNQAEEVLDKILSLPENINSGHHYK